MLQRIFFVYTLSLCFIAHKSITCSHYQPGCNDTVHQHLERWTEQSNTALNAVISIKDKIDFFQLPTQYASAAREHEQRLPELQTQQIALLNQKKDLLITSISFKAEQEALAQKQKKALALLTTLTKKLKQHTS